MPTLKSIEENIHVIKSCREWGISGPTDINNPSICSRYVRDGLGYHRANEECKRVRAENGAVTILEKEGHRLNAEELFEISCHAHSMSTAGMNWRQFARVVASKWSDRNDC